MIFKRSDPLQLSHKMLDLCLTGSTDARSLSPMPTLLAQPRSKSGSLALAYLLPALGAAARVRFGAGPIHALGRVELVDVPIQTRHGLRAAAATIRGRHHGQKKGTRGPPAPYW